MMIANREFAPDVEDDTEDVEDDTEDVEDDSVETACAGCRECQICAGFS